MFANQQRPEYRIAPAILAVLTCLVASCADPVHKGERFAGVAGLERDTVMGTVFRHVVFRNTVSSGDSLHFYIEGDGSPYIDGRRPAADPTPRNPLMLRLMALDRSSSVYIGRPCYWGLAADAGCDPVYWTVGRFNASIVESCSAVIRAELARSHARRWSLYAHSGGAAIAILIAQHLGTAERIVTIGANLDINAWTALHGYAQLGASEDPATRLGSPLAIPTTHYVGTHDLNTPPVLVRAAARRVGGEVVVVDGYTHNCCWERIWPDILTTPSGQTYRSNRHDIPDNPK